MADDVASPSQRAILFNVRGTEPRGPLAERLLRDSRRTEAATDSSSVILIDGQSTGPDVVREVISAGLDRPLLLLHAGREMRAALKLPVSFVNESDAYLVLPGEHGEPSRIVDFSRPESEPTRFSSSGKGNAVFESKVVEPGEIPPPEPEPPFDVPDRFSDAQVETDAIAAAVMREIAAFQRSEPEPAEFPEIPKDVRNHRYPSLTKSITVHQADAYYGTKYAPEQVGTMSLTYSFTGFRNLDSNGVFQSYILVIGLAAGTAPSGAFDLVTRVEAKDLNQNRYLGWFQDSIIVGFNYQLTDNLLLLGTTPNTINKTIKQATTKGFSVDIGFDADAGGAKPKLGLNFKQEVSTETSFMDWTVGELTGLFKPDITKNETFLETAKWRYAVAHPYNGVLDGDLLIQNPDVSRFTPQTTSGFDFVAATALEIPADSPAALAKKVTFDAVLGWVFRYYYAGSFAFAKSEFRHFYQLSGGEANMELDLSLIDAKPGGQNG
jgi:hypothetical protein